jgi:hypothetical protein
MRRREFIGLVGGAAAWPFVARAQQRERLRRVVVLEPIAKDTPSAQARYTAFLQAFERLGWMDGRNVQIVARWSGGNSVELSKYAEELVALAPDVILAGGSTGAEAMLKATRTIPIVFAVAPDPVGAGIVERLSRPGGNTTGFVMFEYNLCGKWLELLREIAPTVKHAAVLRGRHAGHALRRRGRSQAHGRDRGPSRAAVACVRASSMPYRSEVHLRRILRSYACYYNRIRTHRSLDKDAPISRPVQRTGVINPRAIFGGLLHHYARV